MHFLDKRINVICEELKKLKVKQKFTIDDWKYKEGIIRDNQLSEETLKTSSIKGFQRSCLG